MSCIPLIPPLYGVGTGVASPSSPQIPPAICYPSQPQRPPQQQSQQQLPPTNPQLTPQPSQAKVNTIYGLSFPPFVGVNVKVFWIPWTLHILPPPGPIALEWYFPATGSPPHILTTTINSYIYTGLEPFIDESGKVRIGENAYLDDGYSLLVTQFLFLTQRWLVVLHEVDFPTGLSANDATPEDYRHAIQNRQEKLVRFYDSALEGFGSFTYRFLTIYLAPTDAFIVGLEGNPEYHIQPTDNTAYCMLIQLFRRT